MISLYVSFKVPVKLMISRLISPCYRNLQQLIRSRLIALSTRGSMSMYTCVFWFATIYFHIYIFLCQMCIHQGVAADFIWAIPGPLERKVGRMVVFAPSMFGSKSVFLLVFATTGCYFCRVMGHWFWIGKWMLKEASRNYLWISFQVKLLWVLFFLSGCSYIKWNHSTR